MTPHPLAQAAAKWYETARRALTARAVVIFGRAEGAQIAKPLEHEPLSPPAVRPGSISRW